MGFTYLIALLVAAISLVRGTAPLADDGPIDGGSRPVRAILAALAVVGSYVLELCVFEQNQGVKTPIPALSSTNAAVVLDTIFILQSCLLFALARAIGRPSRFLIFVLGFAAVVMLALSLNYRSTGGDVLAYVGSTLEVDPYLPSQEAFQPAFAVINKVWGLPSVPSTYGPLWNAVAKVVASPFTTLRGKILGMQLLQAVALISIVVTLVRTKASPAVIALVALNPFLWETYVAEGHNDLLAAAFIVAAARSTRVASIVLLVVAAAATKASFALSGLAALAKLRRRRDRVLGFFAISILTAAIVALVGPKYPRAIIHGINLYAHPLPFGDVALRWLTELAVSGFALVAIYSGRVPWGTGWITIAIGQFPLTNYLCWGLPTALVGNGATIFLVALPYATFEANNFLSQTPISAIVRVLVAIVLASIFVSGLKRTRSTTGSTEQYRHARGI